MIWVGQGKRYDHKVAVAHTALLGNTSGWFAQYGAVGVGAEAPQAMVGELRVGPKDWRRVRELQGRGYWRRSLSVSRCGHSAAAGL